MFYHLTKQCDIARQNIECIQSACKDTDLWFRRTLIILHSFTLKYRVSQKIHTFEKKVTIASILTICIHLKNCIHLKKLTIASILTICIHLKNCIHLKKLTIASILKSWPGLASKNLKLNHDMKNNLGLYHLDYKRLDSQPRLKICENRTKIGY